MHGPSKNTGRCILKEKIEGLALSEDSPLGKTVFDMANQFVHCLWELYMRKGEAKELEELIQRYNLNVSFLQNQADRMYKNHVESLRETGDFRKNLQ